MIGIGGTRWRNRKTGKVYVVLGRGYLDSGRRAADGTSMAEPIIVYQTEGGKSFLAMGTFDFKEQFVREDLK